MLTSQRLYSVKLITVNKVTPTFEVLIVKLHSKAGRTVQYVIVSLLNIDTS